MPNAKWSTSQTKRCFRLIARVVPRYVIVIVDIGVRSKAVDADIKSSSRSRAKRYRRARRDSHVLAAANRGRQKEGRIRAKDIFLLNRSHIDRFGHRTGAISHRDVNHLDRRASAQNVIGFNGRLRHQRIGVGPMFQRRVAVPHC